MNPPANPKKTCFPISPRPRRNHPPKQKLLKSPPSQQVRCKHPITNQQLSVARRAKHISRPKPQKFPKLDRNCPKTTRSRRNRRPSRRRFHSKNRPLRSPLSASKRKRSCRVLRKSQELWTSFSR